MIDLTREIEDIVDQKIQDSIPEFTPPRDGKDGRNGKDGKRGERGERGQNGRDGKDGVDGVDGKDGRDGNEITPLEIREKLESFTNEDEKLSIDAIGNLPDKLKALEKKVDEAGSVSYTTIAGGSGTTPVGATEWGDITGTLGDQTDLINALNAKAPALETDDNYVTDAEKTVIGNTSGVNTGDESQSTIKTKLGAASAGVDGYMTGTYATKLDGIAAGAEVNVNADWNASSGDAQILNKPTIPTQYTVKQIQSLISIRF